MKAIWFEQQRLVTPEELLANGIDYRKFDLADKEKFYDGICEEFGFKTRNQFSATADANNIGVLVEKFGREHNHSGPEARGFEEGTGVFQIRSKEFNPLLHALPSSTADKYRQLDYIHMELGPGDFINIPEGRYHRFFFAGKLTAERFFKENEAEWIPKYRHEYPEIEVA